MLAGPVEGSFDAAYAIDVLEHIAPEQEESFISNMARSLSDRGLMIVGIPSLHSQVHASPLSRAGHVNCKDAAGLKKTILGQFHHVFIFSMNDEGHAFGILSIGPIPHCFMRREAHLNRIFAVG